MLKCGPDWLAEAMRLADEYAMLYDNHTAIAEGPEQTARARAVLVGHLTSALDIRANHLHGLYFHLQIETPAGWLYLRSGRWNTSTKMVEIQQIASGNNLTDSLEHAQIWKRRGPFTPFQNVASFLSVSFAVRAVASCGGCIIDKQSFPIPQEESTCR